MPPLEAKERITEADKNTKYCTNRDKSYSHVTNFHLSLLKTSRTSELVYAL